MTTHDLFTTETTGLVDVSQPTTIRLHDGDYFDLRIAPARKNIDGDDLRMLAYNGSIPGPNLHVDQGSEITVRVKRASCETRSIALPYGPTPSIAIRPKYETAHAGTTQIEPGQLDSP